MKLPTPRYNPLKYCNELEYYTLKEAVEILEIVCQKRDLPESDVKELASRLGITFHVVARPIAMGDTLIIPPNPRSNIPIKLYWEDLQCLIDYCEENPQFAQDIQRKEKTRKEKRLETMLQVNKEYPDLKTKREVLEKCKEKNNKDFFITFESFSTGSTSVWREAKNAGIIWNNIG